MIDTVLLVVTPTTVLSAVVVGAALGLVFWPIYGRTLGVARERVLWQVFIGTEVVGVTFFATTMVARYLDGTPTWPAWAGNIILWTIMAGAASLTRRTLRV